MRNQKSLDPIERLRREGYREGTILVHPAANDEKFTLIHGFLRENQSGSWSVVEFEGEAECSETYPAGEVLKVTWGPPPRPFRQGDSWWEEWAGSRLERYPPPVELDARKEISAALLALTARSGRTLDQLFPGQEETVRLWVEGKVECARCTGFREVLETLVDLQNGSPLPKYDVAWNQVMNRAYELVGRDPFCLSLPDAQDLSAGRGADRASDGDD